MKYGYTILRKDSSDSIELAMRRLAATGWKCTYFKYVEYPATVKGEGLTIMQSYIAVMEIAETPGDSP